MPASPLGVHKAMDKSGAILGPIGRLLILVTVWRDRFDIQDLVLVALYRGPGRAALFFIKEERSNPLSGEHFSRRPNIRP